MIKKHKIGCGWLRDDGSECDCGASEEMIKSKMNSIEKVKETHMKALKKEFEKRFVRKNLGGEDKGKYQWEWFLKDTTTAEDMWQFIQQALSQTRQEERQAILNESDKKWKTLKQAYEEGREEREKEIISKTKQLLRSIVWESEWQKVRMFLDGLITDSKGKK